MYVVLCNCPPAAAPSIARQLVEERLAACVNILPAVKSIYLWKDALCEEEEHTLFIKVTREAYAKLAERIVALHPYSVPEIIGLPAEVVHPPYRQWAQDVIRS